MWYIVRFVIINAIDTVVFSLMFIGICKFSPPAVFIGLQRKVGPAIPIHVIVDFLLRAVKRGIGEKYGFRRQTAYSAAE